MRDDLILGMPAPAGMVPVEWRISDSAVGYEDAVAFMDARVEAIARGDAPELVWLVEHPPLYTAGTGANPADLLDSRFPLFESGRGGQMTYHGPGQRVAYVLLDLKRRAPDLYHFGGFVPCGVSVARYGVTSLADLGIPAAMPDVDVALRGAFEELFGPTQDKEGQNVGSSENSSPGTRALKSASVPVR
jgi:lipoate-protein ligase B